MSLFTVNDLRRIPETSLARHFDAFSAARVLFPVSTIILPTQFALFSVSYFKIAILLCQDCDLPIVILECW